MVGMSSILLGRIVECGIKISNSMKLDDLFNTFVINSIFFQKQQEKKKEKGKKEKENENKKTKLLSLWVFTFFLHNHKGNKHAYSGF